MTSAKHGFYNMPKISQHIVESIRATDVAHIVVVVHAVVSPFIEAAVQIFDFSPSISTAIRSLFVVTHGEEKVVDNKCSSFVADGKYCQKIKYFMIFLIMNFLIVNSLKKIVLDEISKFSLILNIKTFFDVILENFHECRFLSKIILSIS